MIYQRIKTTNDPLFKSCWEIYCANFPLEERRDLLEQKRMFDLYGNDPEGEERFIFMALLKKKTECQPAGSGDGAAEAGSVPIDGIPCIPVGIFAYWNFSNVIFGEHLAISQHVQGMGIGKIAMEHLKAFALRHQKPIVLEIELPCDTLTKRRETFYKRLDFKSNPHEHFQPCYHPGDEPIEMLILSWPNPIAEVTYEQFKAEQLEIMPRF